MRFISVSDVHIKEEPSLPSDLVSLAFKKAIQLNVDAFFLSGDIFDLMAGYHPQYYTRFKTFFSGIQSLLKNGINVYYIEGNHDVHLEEIFSRWRKSFGETKGVFKTSKSAEIFQVNDKKIYISHGDEWEPGNLGYKRYKRVITSGFCRFLADKIMPYFILEYVGKKASQKSRKVNHIWEVKEEEIKLKFRTGVKVLAEKNNLNIVVGGHSHVLDLYDFSNGINQCVFSNNGYLPHTKKCIYFDGEKLGHISLMD